MKLLILSAGAGAGHNRAAEALEATCREASPTVSVRWADTLRYTPALFRRLYADSYLWMANYTPSLYGLLYKLSGKKIRPREHRLVRSYDRMSYRRFMRFFDRERPSHVIATHFLAPKVVLAHRGRHRPPLYVVVTDFDVHPAWFDKNVDGYFVATEEVRWQIAKMGYPEDRIWVTGIPIHPSFTRRHGAARASLRLPEGATVVLFMSGGFGVGEMEKAVDRLLGLPQDFELVVICGRNEALRRKLSRRRRLRVHGFVRNVPDFLEASDLVITKAGGLTVSECLAKGAPMVVFAPIPGQEERNCDYLLERGAAVKAKGLDVLDFRVGELLDHPRRLARMKDAALAAARPDAAREILRRVLE